MSEVLKNNMSTIKYSVLMSVYYKENPEFFDISIQSMLSQTLLPDQIVIVKDGMLTSDLNAVINKYVKEEPYLFTIVQLAENIGLGKALDEGLKHCRNELIARMDTDDISLPNRCREQIQMFLDDPELSLVGTMIDEFYDTPDNIVSSRIVPTDHPEIKRSIRRRSPFNHPTVMFKKSAVIDAGGYGNFRRKQDLDLFSRMVNSGCKTANINKSLLLFRSNEDSFKRRKSWSYCKSYIDVQYEIWKRGHCSFFDLVYVALGQIIIFISPLWLLKWLSNKFLRKNVSEKN